jgi:ABC-type glycerol-3-phosphate transport system substrate-binding protein
VTRLLALVSAAGVIAAACGRPSPAPARDLVFWTTPVDAPADSAAPDVAEQGEFFDHLPQYFQKKYRERLSPRIRVTDVRGKTRDDAEFARQVLGQHLFLRELSEFIDRQPGGRAIEVKFLKWEELFGALDDLNGDAEGAPEVTIVPSSWVASLSDSALAPLDRPPYAVNTSGYAERALETCRTANGALYALPWIIDVRFFFYWKDLFPPDASFENRAQLARALDGSSRLQLARVGTAFKPPFVLPTEADWDILHLFSLFVWNSGGDWRARRGGWRDGGLAVLTADDGVNAVAAMKELAATSSMAFLQVKRNDLEGRFVTEEIASVLAGPWLIRRLQEKYNNPSEWYLHVGVALPPFNEGGTPTTYLGGSHLGVTTKAAHDPLAIELIEYITAQAAARTAPDNLTIPAADGARKALLDSFPPDSPMRALIPKAIEHSRSYPPVAEWPRAVEVELSHVRLPLLFMHVAEKESAAAVARDLAEMRHALVWGVLIAPLLWPELPLSVAGIVAAVGTFLFLFWRRAKKREFDDVRARLEIREQEMRVGVQQAKQALADKEREMDALNETRRVLEGSLREFEVAIRVLEERTRQDPSDPIGARMRDLESARFEFERKLESIETVMKAEREALVDLARSAGSLATPSSAGAPPEPSLNESEVPQPSKGRWLLPPLGDVLERAAGQGHRRA